MNSLEVWQETISKYEKLSFKEAKTLYQKSLDTDNEELKKAYFDKIVLGTLYVVFRYIKKYDFDKLIGYTYDSDDVISAFIEVWINKIRQGQLLDYSGFSFIMKDIFMIDVYNSISGRKTNRKNATSVRWLYLARLFQMYANIVNQKGSCNLDELRMCADDELIECIDRFKNYDIIEIFKKAYNDACKDNKVDLSLRHAIFLIKLAINNESNVKNDYNNVINFNTLSEEDVLNSVVLEDLNDDLSLCLTDDELMVLNYRFGLNNYERKTRDEIAVILKKERNRIVGRERVRQIETRALRKLKEEDKISKYKIVMD